MTTYFYDAFGPGFDPDQEKEAFNLVDLSSNKM